MSDARKAKMLEYVELLEQNPAWLDYLAFLKKELEDKKADYFRGKYETEAERDEAFLKIKWMQTNLDDITIWLRNKKQSRMRDPNKA